MARKEFSLSKQNKHTGIAQHNMASNRYLPEFATFVLHPTLNYGPFNFTIMDNGGGDAENQRFSSAHSEKVRERNNETVTHPLFITETATLGAVSRVWRKSRLSRLLELGK